MALGTVLAGVAGAASGGGLNGSPGMGIPGMGKPATSGAIGGTTGPVNITFADVEVPHANAGAMALPMLGSSVHGGTLTRLPNRLGTVLAASQAGQRPHTGGGASAGVSGSFNLNAGYSVGLIGAAILAIYLVVRARG